MDNNEVVDTFICDYEAFGSVVVSLGEQVFLYRRLQDAHDKTLIAVVNELNEAIGYLDREAAVERILPALKEGVRFQCVISGEPDGDRVPVRITPVAQAEVSAILARRGGRRGGASSVPPLAGLFDEDVPEEHDLAEVEIDDEIEAIVDEEPEQDKAKAE